MVFQESEVYCKIIEMSGFRSAVFAVERKRFVDTYHICIIADTHEEIIVSYVTGLFTVGAFFEDVAVCHDSGTAVNVVIPFNSIYFGILTPAIALGISAEMRRFAYYISVLVNIIARCDNMLYVWMKTEGNFNLFKKSRSQKVILVEDGNEIGRGFVDGVVPPIDKARRTFAIDEYLQPVFIMLTDSERAVCGIVVGDYNLVGGSCLGKG